MNIKQKVLRTKPAKPDVGESDKITFKDIVWAAVVWLIENVLMLLGRVRQQERRPKGIRKIGYKLRQIFQFLFRPVIMLSVLAGIIITCLTILFIFGKEKKD